MTKDLIRLERHELRILHARVLKLRPLVHNARHARQGAAHSLAPLQTPHHDAVTIVIELTRTTSLERTEERHRKRTFSDFAQPFLAARQTFGRAQRSHHHVVCRRARRFASEVPEPAPSMA